VVPSPVCQMCNYPLVRGGVDVDRD
jgi:hypothetical protein